MDSVQSMTSDQASFIAPGNGDSTEETGKLLVALDVVRLVLVPVVVRRGLALRRGEIGPDAGGVRSVSFPNLVFDRPGDLDRPLNMIGVDELRLLRHRGIPPGSDETAEVNSAVSSDPRGASRGR